MKMDHRDSKSKQKKERRSSQYLRVIGSRLVFMSRDWITLKYKKEKKENGMKVNTESE